MATASVTNPDPLAPHHRAQLEASSISELAIRDRGYWTETAPAALEELGFGRAQTLMVSHRTPTLVVPLYGPDGRRSGHLHRPDLPRTASTGRTVRYEYPRGATMVLDVPPGARAYLDDPAVPLIVTEGVKKADALLSAGRGAVALLGVDCWRGSRATGGRLVLPEWEHVALNGRRVVVAFDSDLADKAPLRGSTNRFCEWLRSRGADVRIWLIPPGAEGAKWGVDDYLAGGGSLRALDDAAVAELPPAGAPAPVPVVEVGDEYGYDPREDYEMTARGLLWVERRNQRDRRRVPLTNFEATVTEDVARDDGLVVSREYRVEARRVGADGRPFHREIRVPAVQWESLGWVTRDLPAGYQVIPGEGHRDRVQYAIRALSDPIPERLIYSHLGWREHHGEWIYLHGAGAIGPRGAVPDLAPEVDGVLRHYALPDPEADRTGEAVEAVLGFLDLAPREQTWPILAAMWTAPLATLLPMDAVLWVYGPTGERKSSLVSLALCQYGAFGKNSLPVGFTSTANGVEGACFAAKDHPLVLDDFNPSPDPQEQRAQKAVAYRLIRAVGDTRGRIRATQSGGLQLTRYPRCLLLVTAEEPPPGGQSTAARCLEVPWGRGSVDLVRLSEAQRTLAPLYGQSTAGYVQWLAQQRIPESDRLTRFVAGERGRQAPGHGRIQETVAKLLCGVGAWLRYAVQRGGLGEERFGDLLVEARDCLGALAGQAQRQQQDLRPTEMLRVILQAILTQGLGYLAHVEDGGPPPGDIRPFGWQAADGGLPSVRPGSVKLGWVSGGGEPLYLLPAAVYQAVVGYAQRSGTAFPLTQRGLSESLLREGSLCQTNRGRSDFRICAEGSRPTVWVVSSAWLVDGRPLPPTSPDTAPLSQMSQMSQILEGEGPGEAIQGADTANTADRDEEHSQSIRQTSPAEDRVKNCDICDTATREVLSSTESTYCTPYSTPDGPLPVSEDPESVSQTENGSATSATGISAEGGPSVADVADVAVSGPGPGPLAAPGEARAWDFQVSPDYTYVTDPAVLPRVLEGLAGAPYVALDIETYGPPPRGGLDPRRGTIRLLSLCTPAHTWVVDARTVPLEPLWPVLEQRTLLGHYLQFDLGFLWQRGFRPGVRAGGRGGCVDTYLLSQLCTAGQVTKAGQHSLAALAKGLLGRELPKAEQTSDWGRAQLTQAQLAYAVRDVQVLPPLVRELELRLGAVGLLGVAEIECAALPAVVWCAVSGVGVDVPGWEAQLAETEAELRHWEAELNRLAPPPPQPPPSLPLEGIEPYTTTWLWSSPEQMARALREAGLYVTGTADSELAALPGPLADACRRWRAYYKQTTAFGRAWLEQVQDGRVYPDWRQLGAEATGRMSCRDPNLQQLPRSGRYRHCVTAAPGHVLIAADYSQIELRIAALVSRDPAMLRAYRNGDDLHTLSARSLFGREEVSKHDRQIAKSANFGLLYGMGAGGLQAYAAATYGVELTLEQAGELRQKWLSVYSGIQRWHRDAHRRLQQTESGVEVRTLAGRRRTGVRSYTQVLNTPVQGLGADGLKAALARLWATRGAHGGERWRPVLICHDEIVIEAPDYEAAAAAAWLRDCMVAGMAPLLRHGGVEVPVEVEVSTGASWGACK